MKIKFHFIYAPPSDTSSDLRVKRFTSRTNDEKVFFCHDFTINVTLLSHSFAIFFVRSHEKFANQFLEKEARKR